MAELQSPTGIKLHLRKVSNNQSKITGENAQQNQNQIIRVKSCLQKDLTELDNSRIVPKIIIRRRPLEKETDRNQFIYKRFIQENSSGSEDENIKHNSEQNTFRNYVQIKLDDMNLESNAFQDNKVTNINSRHDLIQIEGGNQDIIASSDFDSVHSDNNSDGLINLLAINNSDINQETDSGNDFIQKQTNDDDLKQNSDGIMSLMQSSEEGQEINLLNFDENESINSNEFNNIQDSHFVNEDTNTDSLHLSQSFDDDEAEYGKQQKEIELNEFIINELVRNAIKDDENCIEEEEEDNDDIPEFQRMINPIEPEIHQEERDSSEFIITPEDMHSMDINTKSDQSGQPHADERNCGINKISANIVEENAIEE